MAHGASLMRPTLAETSQVTTTSQLINKFREHRHDAWPISPSYVQEVALRCDGAVSGGCTRGGSFGSSAMYGMDGKSLCYSCIVKYLEISELPAKIKANILKRYILQ